MLVAIGIFFYVRKIFEKSRHEIYNITIDGDQAHFDYFTGWQMSPRQEGRVVSLQDIVAEPIGPDVYELVVDDDLIGVLRMKAVVPNQRKPIREIFRIE